MQLLYKFLIISILVGASVHSLAQCGGTTYNTTVGSGNWTTGANWSRGSQGCSMSGENRRYIVNQDMTARSTNCGTITMGTKTKLNVINNSTLTIEGNFTLNGEEICVYVETGSEIIVLGNVSFTKDKVTLDVDGNFSVYGDLSCSGDCTGGGATYPAFSGSGTYATSGDCNGFPNAQCSSSTSGNTLPVELLFFKATKLKDHVSIKWSTATELNNNYFIVEKSHDSQNFDLIGKIDGAGDSKTKKEYSIKDAISSTEITYYRLSQVDYDGTKTVFKLAYVHNSFFDNSFSIYPNPLSSNELKITGSSDSNDQIILVDASGKVIHRSQLNNNGKITLDRSHLSKGLYYVRLINEKTGVNKTRALILE